MKFCVSVLFALYLASVDAFVPQVPFASIQNYVKSFPIYMGDSDEWYADYDATQYKQNDSTSGGDNNEGDNGGYGKRGGRGGGGHRRRRVGSVYKRDTSGDNSKVEEAAVLDLIQERTEARRSHDFHTADAIRGDLMKKYGVSLDDRESTWCTGQNYGGGGRQRTGDRRDRGRHGPTYERDTSRDTSNVDEAVVFDLLQQRTKAREFRDYDAADAIREDLLKNYHVGIDDRGGTWRTGVSASGSGSGGGRFGGLSERKQRDFGPTGHDYEQSATMGPNTSKFTEAEIHELLAERLQAKMSRNFSVSDGIQMNLIEGGVFVHDEMKEWRADGVPYGSLEGRDFGPTGHDYEQSADMGPNTSKFTEEEIHEMLAERLQAKISRKFSVSDGIQIDLNEGGVYVHDRMKEWRADGVPYGSLGIGNGSDRTVRGRNDRQSYTKAPQSKEIEGVEDSLIVGLVEERAKFKKIRNYETADQIRAELKTKFNVFINDRLRQWSVGDHFEAEKSDNVTNRSYVKSSSSLQLSPEDEEFVQQQIDKRLQAKRDHDFQAADDIRAELADRFDVTLYDKIRVWSVGGMIVYKRRGGGELSEEDLATITEMLSKRYEAKIEKNFDVADAIRDDLTRTFNVIVDDRANEWRIDTDNYVMTGDNNLSNEDINYIDSKMKERFCFKRERSYDEADIIRQELKEKFGVSICDRTKEWSITIPEYIVGGKARLENTSNGQEEHNEDDKQFDDTVETTFAGSADEDSEENDHFDVTAEEDKIEDDRDATEDELLELDSLTKLTVPLLKEKLKIAGLPVSGRKAELISRLLE